MTQTSSEDRDVLVSFILLLTLSYFVLVVKLLDQALTFENQVINGSKLICINQIRGAKMVVD